MADPILVSPDALERLTRAVFGAAGWPEADCAELARHLVLANLSGHDSHGVGMIPAYADAVGRGVLAPSNAPRDVVASGAFLVIDANLALGQKVAADSVSRAAATAHEHGVCVLDLLNAHHIGRIGHYAEQAAAAGLVSMFWVNVAHKSPPVAPFGGREGRLGTNPHAVGVPRRAADPVILDFATSRIALGKVRVAFNKGEAVGAETLLDRDGQETTDPGVMFPGGGHGEGAGALLTFGAHKGSGISVVAELLSAVIGGGVSVEQTPDSDTIINNMLAILIDPARLGLDAAEREARIAAYLAHVRSAAPRDSSAPVLLPGEPERISRAQRRAHGVPIDPTSWGQITAAAARFGVDAERFRT